ncbi:MAG: SRPBCC domain-containing protein [Bacteroidia bacterium]
MKSKIKGSVAEHINATIPRVWEALTKPELIREYLFGTSTETDWKVGSTIRWHGEYEGKKYEDKGKVLKNEEFRMLSYTYWSSMSGIEDLPENYVVVTYSLTDEGKKTKLTITQENIPDEEMKEHAIQNWKKVLDGIKQLLEKDANLCHPHEECEVNDGSPEQK